MDFPQTFVVGASWDKDELIRFWGQKVKGQGHIISVEASSTRPFHQLQLSSLFYIVLYCVVLKALLCLCVGQFVNMCFSWSGRLLLYVEVAE